MPEHNLHTEQEVYKDIKLSLVNVLSSDIKPCQSRMYEPEIIW